MLLIVQTVIFSHIRAILMNFMHLSQTIILVPSPQQHVTTYYCVLLGRYDTLCMTAMQYKRILFDCIKMGQHLSSIKTSAMSLK